jgi:hypothetical protein
MRCDVKAWENSWPTFCAGPPCFGRPVAVRMVVKIADVRSHRRLQSLLELGKYHRSCPGALKIAYDFGIAILVSTHQATRREDPSCPHLRQMKIGTLKRSIPGQDQPDIVAIVDDVD